MLADAAPTGIVGVELVSINRSGPSRGLMRLIDGAGDGIALPVETLGGALVYADPM